MEKVSSISWSSNGKRLAICTADRVVSLYDESGNKRDKFPTKGQQKSYVVRAIEFSPDS
jgi:intraflagellar transport protein 172